MPRAGLMGSASAALIIFSFFLPWVTLAPIDYTGMPPLAKAAFDGLIEVLKRVGGPEIQLIFNALERVTVWSGWRLLTENPFAELGLRVVVALPTLIAGLTLLGQLVALRSERIRALVGAAQATGAAFALVALIVNIPAVERLGLPYGLAVRIGISALGSELDLGLWLTMVGSTLLIVSGTLLSVHGFEQATEPEFIPKPFYPRARR